MSPLAFAAGVAQSDLIYAQCAYVEALEEHRREKGEFPSMNHDALMENYPGPTSPCSRSSTTRAGRITACVQEPENKDKSYKTPHRPLGHVRKAVFSLQTG